MAGHSSWNLWVPILSPYFQQQLMDEKKRLSSELGSVKQKNQAIKRSFDEARDKLDTEIADLKVIKNYW